MCFNKIKIFMFFLLLLITVGCKNNQKEKKEEIYPVQNKSQINFGCVYNDIYEIKIDGHTYLVITSPSKDVKGITHKANCCKGDN